MLTDLSRIARAQECQVSDLRVSDRGFSATVSSKSGRTHNPHIFFDGTYICDCEDYVMRRKFCKHLVALFRIAPEEARKRFYSKTITTTMIRVPLSITRLNSLLGGGVPINVVLTITGPTKAGKTWLATQLAFEVSSALSMSAIYIDTEGFFNPETENAFRGYFRRFSRANVIFSQVRDPTDLADLLGLNVSIVRRGDSHEVHVTKDRPPLLEYAREQRACVIVIDSLSYVLKSMISFALQNLAPRANVVNAMYSQLDYIAASLPALVIVVQHVSFNPRSQEFKLYGGPTMMYLVKYALFVQKLSESKRRIVRLVWPGMPEDSVEVEMRRDYGYV